jgi:hypothetical protein
VLLQTISTVKERIGKERRFSKKICSYAFIGSGQQIPEIFSLHIHPLQLQIIHHVFLQQNI